MLQSQQGLISEPSSAVPQGYWAQLLAEQDDIVCHATSAKNTKQIITIWRQITESRGAEHERWEKRNDDGDNNDRGRPKTD